MDTVPSNDSATQPTARSSSPLFRGALLSLVIATIIGVVAGFSVDISELTAKMLEDVSNYKMNTRGAVVPLEDPTASMHSAAMRRELRKLRPAAATGTVMSSATGATVVTNTGAATPLAIDTHQGVYLTASSVANDKKLSETIASIKASGGTSIVFDVKGGTVLFHSAAPMANEIDLVSSVYELPEILRIVHENGLYSIGRFVAIKDHGLTEKLPKTKVRSPKTNAVLSETWVDPSNDVAIEYNMQVICELAGAGINEINLDYIRFSTAEVGLLRVYSGKEKADKVEKFIKATRETINRCGPNTKLGLSTYAILGWDYDRNVETLGQDVVRFAPYVDIISPMAYPATFTSPEYYIPGKNKGTRMYHLVRRTLTGYAEKLGPVHAQKIRPWIQGYSVVAKDVRDQIQAVYDAGFCGYMVWNAGNNYGQTFAAMAKDDMKPENCKTPVHGAAEGMDW